MNVYSKWVVMAAAAFLTGCVRDVERPKSIENASSMSEIGSIDIGDAGAAEISTYDPETMQLFVVNNGTTNKIDILDLSTPERPSYKKSIPLSTYGGFVNSLDIHNGILAAALESVNKQDVGKVVFFQTSDLKEIKVVPVGALPDMLTFTPDGTFLLTANEGEPSSDYTNDPVGSISLISMKDYSVKTLDFSAFANEANALKERGFRIFGPGTNFSRDIEPEYICIAPDSRTAWVSLQENNGLAQIDLVSQRITRIFPLGFKHYMIEGQRMDLSDRDNTISFSRGWNVKGMYQPDAISVVMADVPLVFTANEGDAREYAAFAEVKRLKDCPLDPLQFPNASELKQDANLGRLNITTSMGDRDGDGDLDELFSFGARSFSIWNGVTGALVYDSKNDLETIAAAARLYDDGRSDDKGTEPEGITVGMIGDKRILFVGLERADAVVLYDISNPYFPILMTILPTGDAPEGILFIPAKDSPNGKSLLVVSSENDGVVRIYSTR